MTAYSVADSLCYSKWPDEGGKQDTSVDIRFTDGGKGYVSMNVRYRLPSEPEKILEIHRIFRSNKAFQLGAIEQMAMQAVQLTASMMTAEDSYRNKRPQFISMVMDQIINGFYETQTEVTKKTESEGEMTTQKVVYGDQNNPRRKPRDIDSCGVVITQVNVTNTDYEPEVEQQIAKKRKASMQAELAKVEAEKARQATAQAEEEGKRDVMKAKYTEEQVKIAEVTRAEKDKDVAEIGAQKQLEVAKLVKERAMIDVEKAELEKQAAILKAEGEAQARKLVMEADGALEKKLEAYANVHKVWADAYTKQRPTPDIVFGQTEGSANAAQTMMDILGVRAARDLQMDLGILASSSK